MSQGSRLTASGLPCSIVTPIVLIGLILASPEPAMVAAARPVEVQAGSVLQGPEKNEIISRAAQAYYSLKSDGLTEFHCQAEPDWDSMLKTMKPPPTDPDQLTPLLKQLRFEVAVGPDGGAIVSHHSDAAPPSQQMAERLRRVTGGVDQVLTGFFQVWAPFPFGTFFPASGQPTQIEEAGEQYRLTQKQGDADSAVVLTRDFEVTEISVITPKLAATLHPHFTRSEKGYLLNAVYATYKVEANQSNLTMKVEYQNVEGFTLPETLSASVVAQGLEVPIIVKFVAYKVTRRAGK